MSAAGVADVERAAVESLEALTVKLSERSFKPLFLRLVDWARAAVPPAAGAAHSTTLHRHACTACPSNMVTVPCFAQGLPEELLV